MIREHTLSYTPLLILILILIFIITKFLFRYVISITNKKKIIKITRQTPIFKKNKITIENAKN